MEPISQPHRLARRSQAPGLLRSRSTMPNFVYTETFEGGAVYIGMSAGRSKFIPLTAVSRAPCIVFVVDKDRSKRTLSIDVQSYSLCHTISNALDTHPDPDAGNLKSPDFDTLLKNYDTLKQHLRTLESQQRGDLETSEFRLLVEDFLLDFFIFDGLGLEHRQTLLQSYDSTERCIDVALDLVDDCFLLGLFPLDVTDDHLAALNNRSIEDVWNGGLGVFRQVIKNHPPSGLLEVLGCIIVADSMCTALSSCSEQDTSHTYLEFVGDIGRWRSILDPHEHALFDRISYALWLRSNPEELLPRWEDQDGLARFQEALQDLVTLDKKSHKVPPMRGAPYASQLCAIQRKYAAEEANRPRGYPTLDPVLIPVPGDGVRKREFDEPPDMELDFENDFSINDVFDVDRFLAQNVDSESTAGQMMDLGWNDILSTTVLLLASSAFSTFLTLLTVIHRDSDSDSVLDVWRRPPGYSRSCDIVGHFLENVGGRQGRFRDVPLYRPHSFHLGTNRLSLSTMSAPPTGHTWSASSWVNPALGARKMMRASVSAVPIPSPFTPTQMAHSLDAVRDSRRLRCLSASCSKDFSSVSNRNKHMREGCPHREKAGYKCRNEHCTKVLTMKWYQKKHEQERCRYRGVAGGQGSWGGT